MSPPSYVKISANLFGCAAARDRGTCGNRLNIRYDVLEATILDGLKSRLMAPDIFQTFCAEFHREVNRLRIAENAANTSQPADLDRIERLNSGRFFSVSLVAPTSTIRLSRTSSAL
jgi:site-specific DNA recombinase